MYLPPDGTHYEPISWDDAFRLIAEHLNALESPDQAIFYTSGKTSNEAAFAYQLFVRAFGTNNLPDCSNMCHESTSVALAEVLGIGKGSVTLDDIHDAKLIVIAGQNPGTNHPRMLTALEKAKRNGARIIAVNPLREAGLIRFKNPQTPRGVVGKGTALADLHLPIRINGDLALFQAIGALLLEWDAVDHDFVERHTTGFEEWAAHVKALDWDVVRRSTGLTREQIEEAAGMFRDSDATVICWAMGITQHRNAVATVKEFANVAFLQGNIGKPGAGLCPVRGHSNVQGDRTMGIWERPPGHFLDSLRDEFGFEPPREHGFDSVAAIKALRDGDAKVFIGMGGNFVSAAPDTQTTEEAFRGAALTVHVSTKLNRSHVAHGREALILPALGRSEKDLTGGRPQRVTVEDSMSAVHASQGPLEPASPHLRSEVDIVCSLAHGDARRPARHPVGGRSAPTTARSASASRAWCRGATPTRRRSTGPAASRCRTRRATAAPSRPRRTARSSPSARRRCWRCRRATCCCRRSGRTTSSTPRSTAWRTGTAGSRVVAGWCSCTPTTSRRSGSRTARWSTWSASTRRAPPGRRRTSGSSPTTSRVGAPRRTTRRRTRWCRWTTPRRAATSRRRSRS